MAKAKAKAKAPELFPSLNDVQTRSYQDFSRACREVEKELYPDDPSPDMKKVKVSKEAMETIGFLVTITYMLRNQGVEKFVVDAVPRLREKITEIESRTGYLLWFARLILDGLVNKVPAETIAPGRNLKDFYEPVYSTVMFTPPDPVAE